MQYALLVYGSQSAREATQPMNPAIATELARSEVVGWARLHADESATTVRSADSQMLITDGPFIESREYLAGIIMIEAENLDEALAIARDLQSPRSGGAIEVRPIFESLFRDA